MNQFPSGYLFLVISAMICLNQMGCNESFVNQPPFEQVQDTVFLDNNNWYYFSQEAVIKDDVPMFPFSYEIFDVSGNGFILQGNNQTYFLEFGKSPEEAHVLFNSKSLIGDTLNKFSDRHYHLLIDKKYDKKVQDEIYYVLRRSKKGVRTLEERAVWVISQKRGLLAVSNYQINYKTGVVTLDMVGESNFFRDSDFVRKIKYYDYDRAYHVDRERNIIYTFEKHMARLKSKNFERGEELHEYRFKSKRMSELVNFRIESDKNTIKLVAGDSCYVFNEILELAKSGLCD